MLRGATEGIQGLSDKGARCSGLLLAALLAGGCKSHPPATATAATLPARPTAMAASVSRLQMQDTNASRDTGNKSLLDLASFTPPVPQDSRVAVRVRATVNGVPILDEEVRQA